MAPARWDLRLRAAALGPAYPSRRAVSRTRWRTSADICSGRLYALETVETETPASSATVLRVTLPITDLLFVLILHRSTNSIYYKDTASSRARQPPVCRVPPAPRRARH